MDSCGLPSVADLEAEVQDSTALDHDVGILEQVLSVDLTEVALSVAEHDRDDVHRDLIDQADRERLAADIAGAHCHHAVTGALLRLCHRSREVVEERHVGLGVPALGFGPVRHDKQVLARGRSSVPAVGQIEQDALG